MSIVIFYCNLIQKMLPDLNQSDKQQIAASIPIFSQFSIAIGVYVTSARYICVFHTSSWFLSEQRQKNAQKHALVDSRIIIIASRICCAKLFDLESFVWQELQRFLFFYSRLTPHSFQQVFFSNPRRVFS